MDRLESSITYLGDNGNTRMIKLEGNMNAYKMAYCYNKDTYLHTVCIHVSMLVLKVRTLAGGLIERDISCYSTYMLAAIN